MAVRRIAIKITPFFPPKTTTIIPLPCLLPHTTSYPSGIFHPQRSNPHFLQIRSFSLQPHLPCSHIVKDLVAIFTNKRPLDTHQVHALGALLTPQIVETVLNSIRNWRIAHDFFTWASQQTRYKHNCYTYNAMASILSHSRKHDHLRLLALDIVNSRCPMTPGALGFTIRCLGSVGLVDEAIKLFDQLKEMRLCVVNSYTYNCLLEAIANSGRVELLEMRLREMREQGWGYDKFTLTSLLQAYCNARKFEQALSVFNVIKDQGWIDEHVFTILIISFSKWGEIDKALELFQTMEDHNMVPSEKTLCSLIHGVTTESRVDIALHLFDKMRKLGLSPDIRVYTVLINGLCKKKEHEKALCLYSDMKSAGVMPDAIVISNLISSFGGEGDFVTANKFLVEGLQSLDVDNAVVIYNAFLEVFVNYGSAEKAHLLLRAIMGVGCSDEAVLENLFKFKEKIVPNSASYKIVIDGLCKEGKLDEALILFRDMIQMGCEGSTLMYNNLINELCNSDRLEEGFNLLREMKESGFKPTHFTHNCIFGCLCRKGDVSAVLALMKEMRICGHEPWIKHSSMLVKQLCTHGKTLEACHFLNDMAREGFLPDIIAYSAAIDGLFRIREVDMAMKLFHDIFRRGHHPDLVAYNIVICGLLKAGKVLEAQDYLNEMLTKGLLPSVVTYNLMIDGFCKANELQHALLFFKRMVDEAREPTVITYTTLIDGLCNAGRPDDALLLWDEMRKKGCDPNKICYMALVQGLCKCDRPDAARVYFHEMKGKEMRPDIYAYVALISGFISQGHSFLAFEILKEMVATEDFPCPSDKNYQILINAIHKLLQDSTTSSDVKYLVAEGRIPEVCSVPTKELEPIV